MYGVLSELEYGLVLNRFPEVRNTAMVDGIHRRHSDEPGWKVPGPDANKALKRNIRCTLPGRVTAKMELICTLTKADNRANMNGKMKKGPSN